MKVAVCDDERMSLVQLQEMLKKIKQVNRVDLFVNIENFMKTLGGENYDVVLMDIVWERSKRKNGIDFASEIQKISPETRIIYITKYVEEYVEDIFLKPSNLSGVLVKPVKLEMLRKNLEKIEQDLEKTEERLVLRYQGTVLAVPFSHILYLENQLHRVVVVTEQKRYLSSENLERVKLRLDSRFLPCHKSFVVNMDKILEFQAKGIELLTGCLIPVSKSNYKTAKEKYFNYVSDRM